MEAWEWRASVSYNPNKVSQRDRWFLFRVDICSLIYANSSFVVLNARLEDVLQEDEKTQDTE